MTRALRIFMAFAYLTGSLIVGVLWFVSVAQNGIFHDHTLILWALGLAMNAFAKHVGKEAGLE